MTVEDFKGMGLTDDQIENMLILYAAASEDPTKINELIRSSNQEPAEDPEEKVLQLVLAMAVDPKNFDSDLGFLGGFGAMIGKAASGLVGVFKKKEGGSKLGNALRKLKQKIKDKKELKQLNKNAQEGWPEDEMELMEEEDTFLEIPESYRKKSSQDGKPAKSREELEKQNKTFMFISAGLVAATLGFAIWAFTK